MHDCDKLKSTETVFQQDSRSAMYYNYQTERNMTFEDYHGLIEKVTLHERVPDDIRVNFEAAKNTLLYAWYS